MRRFICLTTFISLGATASRPALQAQSSPARPTILLVDFTFYGAKANSIGPGDSTTAQAATERMRSALREADAFSLTDSARASAEITNAELPGLHCNANPECVRDAAQKLGARWAVMGTVSKISNLIWYLSGQVIDVGTGRVILDDGFELKGPRDEMVPRGAVSLARRVETAVGRATSDSLLRKGGP